MRVFFDTEFTGLHQDTTLISLGMVAEDGREFYAEFTDYDQGRVNDWIRENVIAHLQWGGEGTDMAIKTFNRGLRWEYHGTRAGVVKYLTDWLAKYDYVRMWSDVLAYDWMLFCELFGGALNLPRNVYYIPFDLATLLADQDIDPDIDREAFANMGSQYKHHALHDARVIRACFAIIGCPQ